MVLRSGTPDRICRSNPRSVGTPRGHLVEGSNIRLEDVCFFVLIYELFHSSATDHPRGEGEGDEILGCRGSRSSPEDEKRQLLSAWLQERTKMEAGHVIIQESK